MRLLLPGSTGLSGQPRQRRWPPGKTAQKTDEKHPARTGCTDAYEPCYGTERKAQRLPHRTLDEETGRYQKRVERHQQWPAAEGQPFLQRLQADIGRSKGSAPTKTAKANIPMAEKNRVRFIRTPSASIYM